MRDFLLPALFLCPAFALAQITAPVGGWRLSDPDTPYTQTVHYPAVTPGLDVDTPLSAQIRGRIQARSKAPARLVVNGNAMPLRLSEDGMFARPYSFANGSNGVEIRTDEARHRVQFYELVNGRTAARLRVILTWDSDGTDLDLHVLTPGGQHAWYGGRVISGGAIDIDVTSGYGPEIFASPAPEKGLYQIYVNYYGGYGDYEEEGDQSDEGDERATRRKALTIARLTIVANEGMPSERRQEFTVPMRFPGELTRLCQFMYP